MHPSHLRHRTDLSNHRSRRRPRRQWSVPGHMTCTATWHHPRKRSSYQSSGPAHPPNIQCGPAVRAALERQTASSYRRGPLATDVPEWVAVKDCGDLRRSGSDVLTATAVGRPIFVVGDGFVPGDAVAAAAGSFEHGEGGTSCWWLWRRARVRAGRGVDGVALAHLDDGSIASSDEPDAVGDMKGLA